MSDSAQLLKDLITAASISLAPAVAWVTFASNFKDRQQAREADLRQTLLEVKKELEYIGVWAQKEYTDSTDDPTWRQPSWSVRDFPSDRILWFNQAIRGLLIDRKLRATMAALETAIARFRSLLRAHREFVEQRGNQEAVPGASNQHPTPREWLDRLHELNKDIHVKGIGNSHDTDGLHSTRKQAIVEVDRAISGPLIVRHPKKLWVGHVLAFILGVIGVGFLFAFARVLLHSTCE